MEINVSDKKISIGNPGSKKEVELSVQVVKDNEQFLKQLQEEKTMSDDLKEAMREDDFQALMAKKKQENKTQGEENMKTATMKRYVSLKLGILGSGQAGGRIAEVFYKNGYDVCVVNTARQDLEFLDIPEDRKIFIGDEHLGGAGRDLDYGHAAVEENLEAIKDLADTALGEADVLVLAVSGGGGSGSGSAELLVETLADMGRPVMVIYALPGSFDDAQSKHNAITTLAKLADYASREVINSLVLVDNAKIELAFPELSQAAFWKTANNAVVEPLHMFNTVSAMPTDYETLDSMDFAKSLVEAGNCVLFGSNKITKEEYEGDEFALVSAVMDSLDTGLLAGGFNLEESQTVGVLVTANQHILEQIPYSNIAYIFKYISEECASARSFKGVYAVPSNSDDITVHFIFSGLGLPKERIDSLKNEAQKHMKNLDAKKKDIKMGIDLGTDKTTSKADRMMGRLKKNRNAVGKLRNRDRSPRRR
jgi:cell division GTPase FtsZ